MAEFNIKPEPEEVWEALTKSCENSSWGYCSCGGCVDGRILNYYGKQFAKLVLRGIRLGVSTGDDQD